MLLLAIAIFVFGVAEIHCQNAESSDKEVVYRAAVLEMLPFHNPDVSISENMRENTRIMIAFATTAKLQGADIIVFPESATYGYAPSDRPRFLSYTVSIDVYRWGLMPDVYNVPRNEEVLKEMSRAAKVLNIYIVLNIAERVDCQKFRDPECPEDGHYFYNTNVVFDRQGKIASSYRKSHLLDEQQYNSSQNVDNNSTFTTDFGVTFAQHVGAEVLFYQPSLNNIENLNVRDVIMPSAWVENLPFFTAPQVQYGFSRGAGVNLLVAGLHSPWQGSLGSGIYTGATNISNSVYVHNATQGTKLLIADVTTTVPVAREIVNSTEKPALRAPNSGAPEAPLANATSPVQLYVKENLEKLLEVNVDVQISGTTSGDVKPTQYFLNGTWPSANDTIGRIPFILSYDVRVDGIYNMVMHTGPLGYGSHQLSTQVAALVYCPALHHCLKTPVERPEEAIIKSLNWTMKFEVPHLYPSVLDMDLKLVPEGKWFYSKKQEGDSYIVSVIIPEPLEWLYSIVVMGRTYD